MTTVTTISGDTWDTLALRAYGNEKRADALMQCVKNFPLLDYQVFDSGLTVYVPDITETKSETYDLPDWRRD